MSALRQAIVDARKELDALHLSSVSLAIERLTRAGVRVTFKPRAAPGVTVELDARPLRSRRVESTQAGVSTALSTALDALERS